MEILNLKKNNKSKNQKFKKSPNPKKNKRENLENKSPHVITPPVPLWNEKQKRTISIITNGYFLYDLVYI